MFFLQLFRSLVPDNLILYLKQKFCTAVSLCHFHIPVIWKKMQSWLVAVSLNFSSLNSHTVKLQKYDCREGIHVQQAHDVIHIFIDL
ncbi:hypothetical protein PVAP13_7NG212500 [Panicum virgatum]|uniref:Uncharacterized protein n=1 Tax=Panicum virgatum TaxID=38727 RepID=A0A8T0PYX7_PANVG|nr:hypothetical protein PVAP13_7NG212500 [Panicum virgatum]